MIFWLDPLRAYDRNVIARTDAISRPRHPRAGHPHPRADRRGHGHARAPARRSGHHLRHRQRAARLSHRSVPDPGAGHQRQNALDRAAAGRRRAVRDRRRRLGTQARAAISRGGALRWDSLGEFLALQASIEDMARKSGNSAALTWPTRWTRPTACAGERPLSVARGRRARQPRQPLLSGALLGAGARGADRGRGLQRVSSVAEQLTRPRPNRRRTQRRTGLSAVDIGGYYHPIPPGAPRRCVPARPSIVSSPRLG